MPPENKIRVLECIRQGNIGGGESHLLSLTENIDQTNFEPVVLSFTDGPMITRLKEMNIKTYIIPTRKPFDFSVWKKVAALLKEEKIELIHCHGSRATSNLFQPAHSLNIPLIYTIHGWSFHDDQNLLKKKIRIMGEKFLTTKSAINIAVSESNFQSGKKYIPNLEAAVINNGIDLKKFNPENKFNNIRSELKIDLDSILILFIARFTSHKQPLSLIKAFAEILKVKPNLQLLMVGDGDEKKEALKITKSLKIENNIHFLPFRQDVPDLLASADIFVLPSLWEGLPIGLLEAMSMGKSVIATNVDGSKEILKNGENGLVIGTDNLVKNLTDSIIKLSENKQLRNRFSENAIKTVKENFNAVTMTREIEKIYTQVLRNKLHLQKK